MDAFTYIRDFFANSNRGVWGKQEILLALDTLFHKYQAESMKKLQEEINQDVLRKWKEIKP